MDSDIFAGEPENYIPEIRQRYIYYDIPLGSTEDVGHTGSMGAAEPTSVPQGGSDA